MSELPFPSNVWFHKTFHLCKIVLLQTKYNFTYYRWSDVLNSARLYISSWPLLKLRSGPSSEKITHFSKSQNSLYWKIPVYWSTCQSLRFFLILALKHSLVAYKQICIGYLGFPFLIAIHIKYLLLWVIVSFSTIFCLSKLVFAAFLMYRNHHKTNRTCMLVQNSLLLLQIREKPKISKIILK